MRDRQILASFGAMAENGIRSIYRSGVVARGVLRPLFLAAILICALVKATAAAELIGLSENRLSIRFEVEGPWPWRIAGRFNDVRGQLVLDAREPARSWLRVFVHTGSVETGSARRDNSLRSAHFFNVVRHPFMIFESTRLDLIDPNAGIITGDLSLLGMTRPIKLAFEFNAPRHAGPPQGAIPPLYMRATGVLRRSEWGMTALIPVISDEVHLEIRADLAN